MKNILVIGAGRSATALIKYLLSKAEEYHWHICVADSNLQLAQNKVDNHSNAVAVELDIMQEDKRQSLISKADVVVSLLPAFLHIEVANVCLELNKHLVTASYVSSEMQALSEEAAKKGLVFMSEIGLDPGIDHMSAMEKINQIKNIGGELTAFKSYTGGLVAPECDNNPWRYKFTWNPRNVVTAGQGTAQYLENNKKKFTPYNRLFKEFKIVDVKGMGSFEMYANRDSLAYKDVYGLENIPTLVRGTLRNVGFCEAWSAIVKIGLTDASHPILNCQNMSYAEWLNGYTNNIPGATLKERIANLAEINVDSNIMDKLVWMGLFDDKKINVNDASPANILVHLLLEKWKLEQDDKDMIVMQHEFEYSLKGEEKIAYSTLVMKGKDSEDTAMSRLVGLPLGIFVKLLMLGEINLKGVNIPIMEEVYRPVLEELKEYGVIFHETEMVLA